MTTNLITLSFKPGVQRDGTKFQGDLCGDAQWVRFQRGVPKKMGGMLASNQSYPFIRETTNLLLSRTNTAGQLYLYVSDNTGVYRSTINNNFVVSGEAPTLISPNTSTINNVSWQSAIVIRNNVPTVVFLQTQNASDITQTTASVLYSQPLISASGTPLALSAIPPNATGGMCYSAPYLFLYGNNGYVGYSASTNPLIFTGAGTGSINISNDKVIYAANIRGGTVNPSLLFWTVSSMVRVSNVGDATITLRSEVLSSSSSILSSRCVVEYDGLFFWPGTERFFVFNGIVGEMANNTNLNYFYNNLDINKRQLVFGLKNQKYGELWWFYPEIANADDVNIGCTRALIYNKRENCWYDTAISRDAGVSFDDLGIMVTYGTPIVVPDPNPYNYVWMHETGNVITGAGYTENYTPGAGGVPITNPIPSSFTTPIFSWASSFNPTRAPGSRSQPIDRQIELLRIEPDFGLTPTATMTVAVNTRPYAQGAVTVSPTVTFMGNTGKVDMRIQGRQMSLTFSSTSFFEMGNVQLLVGIGDGRV